MNYEIMEKIKITPRVQKLRDMLFEKMPQGSEGRMTRMRAALVREETLAEAARRLEIGRLVRLSIGEERSGGREKNSILADVMESVIAAVYLDGGLEEVRCRIRCSGCPRAATPWTANPACRSFCSGTAACRCMSLSPWKAPRTRRPSATACW